MMEGYSHFPDSNICCQSNLFSTEVADTVDSYFLQTFVFLSTTNTTFSGNKVTICMFLEIRITVQSLNVVTAKWHSGRKEGRKALSFEMSNFDVLLLLLRCPSFSKIGYLKACPTVCFQRVMALSAELYFSWRGSVCRRHFSIYKSTDWSLCMSDPFPICQKSAQILDRNKITAILSIHTYVSVLVCVQCACISQVVCVVML